MTLPFPWPSITNLPQFLQYLNENTNYLFGIVSLFALWIITFISLKQFDSRKAFATASWLTALVSYPFVIMQIVSIAVATLLTVMSFISTILIKPEVPEY